MNQTQQFVDRSGNQWVVVPASQYVDGNTGQRILSIAEQLLERGILHIAVDLSQSRVVNSVGISRLIHMLEKMDSQNGHVVFCGPNAVIGKTLRIMGLLQKAQLYDSVDLAMGHLQG